MNAINYQKELEKIIEALNSDDKKPSLLLHSCCAPCSSYCLVYLRQWFDITCFYYNPNITEDQEYNKRVNELYRLAEELNNDSIGIGKDSKGQIILEDKGPEYLESISPVKVIAGSHDKNDFLEMVSIKNLAGEPEGGKRCVECFNLRLLESARIANENHFDYFSTSLTISPLKNSVWLNEIGRAAAEKYQNGSMWLPSDFKKKNGYKFSIELSERYGLYRQNYCGCQFSK